MKTEFCLWKKRENCEWWYFETSCCTGRINVKKLSKRYNIPIAECMRQCPLCKKKVKLGGYENEQKSN